jgi:hypothetical protein
MDPSSSLHGGESAHDSISNDTIAFTNNSPIFNSEESRLANYRISNLEETFTQYLQEKNNSLKEKLLNDEGKMYQFKQRKKAYKELKQKLENFNGKKNNWWEFITTFLHELEDFVLDKSSQHWLLNKMLSGEALQFSEAHEDLDFAQLTDALTKKYSMFEELNFTGLNIRKKKEETNLLFYERCQRVVKKIKMIQPKLFKGSQDLRRESFKLFLSGVDSDTSEYLGFGVRV